MPARGFAVVTATRIKWLVGRLLGGVLGYGCVAGFLALVGLQTYRWLRQGAWIPIGVSDGLHSLLLICCVKDGDAGRLASLVHWIEAPVDWLGLHSVLAILPASLALFALSIAGNWLFLFCGDKLRRVEPAD